MINSASDVREHPSKPTFLKNKGTDVRQHDPTQRHPLPLLYQLIHLHSSGRLSNRNPLNLTVLR